MTNRRTYRFGKSQLTLEFGDITTSNAQVLVSSDDYYLTMSGGVSAAIRIAGGNAIVLDATKKVPAALGDVVVTTAGTLPAQYIFHAVTIGPSDVEMSPEEVVKQTTQRCMQLIDTLGLYSIAFPAIGAGSAGFSYEDVAVQMAEVIVDDLLKCERPIEATIYLFDLYSHKQPIDFVRFFEEFAARVPRVAPHETESVLPGRQDEIPIPEAVSATADEIKSRRLHNLRKLMTSLEDQRYKLEEHLIDLLSSDNRKDETKEVRQKLQENEELRLRYLTELKSLSEEASVSSVPVNQERKLQTVFVSSTYRDLINHRIVVKDQIARRDMFFRGMEHFGADPSHLAPAAKIVEEVRNAEVYLGIFGVRYGSIDQATGLSMTELEFNEAEASEKHMLLYIIHNDAPVKVCDIEPDPEGRVKLDALKARILQKHTAYMFRTVEDLARQVYEDLGKL